MIYDYYPWDCNYYNTDPYSTPEDVSSNVAIVVDFPDGQDLPDPSNPVL